VDVEGKKPLTKDKKMELKPEVKLERMSSESPGMSPEKSSKRRLQAQDSVIGEDEIKEEEET
jgi:hypothetical protein